MIIVVFTYATFPLESFSLQIPISQIFVSLCWGVGFGGVGVGGYLLELQYCYLFL